MITTLLALAAVLAQDPIQSLEHKHPAVRKAGAEILAAKNITEGIVPLIQLLREETEADVRGSVVASLQTLTGEKFTTHDDWRRWWETAGEQRFPRQTIPSDRINQLLQPAREEIDNKLKQSRVEMRTIGITVGIVAIFFVLVMLYFVGHVSSRLKEWKELVARAENYIGKSEEITKRTDHIVSELEAKKMEIRKFLDQAEEEGQNEMERFSDMLQKNLEHKLREEMMALRQKAEKELEQTLGELRAQMDVEIRRAGSGQSEKSERLFAEQREKFLKEVEAHTLFLEASFQAAHAKHEDALRRYRRLLEIKPDHMMAWNNAGNMCRELERYEEALEAYTKALALAPNSPTVLYNLAATYARLRKKEKMLETLKSAIANDGEYKDEALNDAAFRDYWNDPAFKDIAEG